MDHVSIYKLIQTGLSDRVRNFCTDQPIDMLRCPGLICVIDDQQYVCMRQTPLLKFNDVGVGDGLSHYVFFGQRMEELSQAGAKNASH